jgi:hypothetical protein
MSARTFRISPSDLVFLWEECRRCFYLKAAKDFRQPRSPVAKIFIIIDSKMKEYYSTKRTETIAEGIPPGEIEYSEKWVESVALSVPGHESRFSIKGKFDTAFHFDDQTYGIVDFKTSDRNEEHIPLYSRQLHAYALAVENPAPGQLELKPISKLGLLVFSPQIYTQGKTGMVGLAGHISWIEIARRDGQFFAFLSKVMEVLELPEPPEPSEGCRWCQYRRLGKTRGF